MIDRDAAQHSEVPGSEAMNNSSHLTPHVLEHYAPADVVPIEDLLEEGPSIQPVHMDNDTLESGTAEESLHHLHLSQLNEEQKLAYDIVGLHLDLTIKNQNPPPLHMIMYGCGDTGKSRVIQTISELFERRGVAIWLLKASFTGIAASLIDGKTLHVIGKLKIDSNGNFEIEPKDRLKLQEFWCYYIYLIIDKFSMISKILLAKLSKHIAVGKAAPDSSALGKSFGGINVILVGDLHQFPPVATSLDDALFVPPSDYERYQLSQIGGTIYQEFRTVVILRQQMRVVDPVWHDFLQALRIGQVQRGHLDMLRTLLLQPSSQNSITHEELYDLEQLNIVTTQSSTQNNPFLEAPLVTPRHCIREAWNQAALRQHCLKTHQQLFICPADDRIHGSPLSGSERQAFKDTLSDRKSRCCGKHLPGDVELAIGAQVLVMQNLKTDLDIANGSRGEIVGIYLDPAEPPLPDESTIRLRYLPVFVLVKLKRTRAEPLPGLEPGVIPIKPIDQRISFNMVDGHSKVIRKTVKRRQFPITCAWAFTDYRSQGQTLPYVIVDLAKPPNGKLDLFNLYVALSRSHSRDTIRLLRDFDDSTFLASHNPDLLAEDDRLETLAAQTLHDWQHGLGIYRRV